MRMQKWLMAMVAVAGLQMMGCNAPSSISGISTQTRYTRFNVHCYTRGNDELIGSVVSYYKPQNHSMLPYNAPVKIQKYRKGLVLDYVDGGQRVYFECPAKWINQMPIGDYIELITSTTPVTYGDFSETDQKGVAAGEPRVGMSKQAVMVALGYPAPSFTPSPESDAWYYWLNKFKKVRVEFKNGKVAAIVE